MAFFKVKEGDLYEPGKKLILELIGIHLMAIDTPGATEFEYDEKVLIPLYEKNPELMDCRMASIHSHHSMRAFFSDTDNQELKDGSDAGDFYLMVIVNNTINDWVAKIGFAVEVKNTWEKIFSFKNKKSLRKKGSSETTEHTSYEIDIITPFTPNEKDKVEIDNRIKELEKPRWSNKNRWEWDRQSGSYHQKQQQMQIGFNTKREEKVDKELIDESITELVIDIISDNDKNYKTPYTAFSAMKLAHSKNPIFYANGLIERYTNFIPHYSRDSVIAILKKVLEKNFSDNFSRTVRNYVSRELYDSKETFYNTKN